MGSTPSSPFPALPLQNADRKVIVPNAPGRAVNVGAALYALSPSVITERCVAGHRGVPRAALVH